MGWIDLAQDMGKLRCWEHGNEPGSTTSGISSLAQ